ncbi:MAG TPA: DUF1735 domain-containing protein [Flavisolibacter sp.]|nr:DUF1735 domain-containing protein [Flavisolibacter sp.]
MKLNLIKYFTLIAVLATAFTSCIKDSVDDLGDGGRTRLKFRQAPENNIFFDPFTDVKKVSVFDLRREASSEAELNKAVTVKLRANPAAITAYNTAHGTDFEVLPESMYTLAPGVTRNGDEYTVNFNSGEFAKELAVNIDGSKWDLSKRYALAFSIIDSAGIDLTEGRKSQITFFAIKNEWDGIYSVESGTVTRYTNPTTVESPSTLNGDLAGNPDVELATVGPNTVEIHGLYWRNGSNSTVGGIPGLRATIDPVTNLVTMASVGDASGPANTTLTNKPGADNYYDPATKTFHLSFHWNTTANKREYEIVLKYKEPR